MIAQSITIVNIFARTPSQGESRNRRNPSHLFQKFRRRIWDMLEVERRFRLMGNKAMRLAMDEHQCAMLRHLAIGATKTAGRLVTVDELAAVMLINRPDLTSVLIAAGVKFRP